jgi:predicted DNA-binding protein
MESHGSEPSFVDSSIRVPQEEYQKIKNKARKVAKRTGQSKDELLKGYVEQWKIQNHHCAGIKSI